MGAKAGADPEVLRRASSDATGAIRLAAGFDAAPPLLAYGVDREATFCLLTNGEAVLSPRHGDLAEGAALDAYRESLALYASIFRHRPRALAADRQHECASSRLAHERAQEDGLPLLEVQRHHAHAAACLAENGWPLAGPPVLAMVLNGAGLGDDGALWGGEFLLADYRETERLGTFKPVALLGGEQAAREPWRSLYAHIMAEMSWSAFTESFDELDVYRRLEGKPRAMLDRMLEADVEAPRASSCGRLFDAVAAALGLAFERQDDEGHAGALLEAAVDAHALRREGDERAYPFSIPRLTGTGLPYIEPISMWRALFGDLLVSTPPGVIAARFHRGLARALGAMAVKLRDDAGDEDRKFNTVALSGGCFGNRVLFEETSRRLRNAGFDVLSHSAVPASDGGIALGQAAVAAARLIAAARPPTLEIA